MTDFEEITEITANIATKLRDKGISTVEKLATQTFDELKEKLSGIQETKIKEIQLAVWKRLGYWFTPAKKLAEVRRTEEVFSTGSKRLDNLLQGGIRSREITEFVGEFAAGKTESLLTTLVVNLPVRPDCTAIWFDTEESFSDRRVTQIATERGINAEGILERTIYTPIWHTQHFEEMIYQADSILKARNVKIIFVDSLVASLRAEYIGRETLWHRQQILNKILRILLNYARAFNLAVIVTNQVVADPAQIYTQDPVRRMPPVGGNILAHNAETRLYLRKAADTMRIVRLIDSSWLPPGECVIKISSKGIEDPKELGPSEDTQSPEPVEKMR